MGVPAPVRISLIAGRYLVFDADDVATLRREDNINGTLVGTTPQQPTQNIFLSLPVELRPEEAEALVHKKSAYVVNDVAAHQSALRSSDPAARKAYVEAIKRRKQTAQAVLSEKHAQKAAEVAQRLGRVSPPPSSSQLSEATAELKATSSSNADPGRGPLATNPQLGVISVTPTSSRDLITRQDNSAYIVRDILRGPLCSFLQDAGYYMTPGLRFGARYSVYPGDPLRFHAHFMANQYEWDEQIPLLDIVGGGRLATAVKKAFLIGGQEPSSESMRVFSIEWAAM
ncbi:putative tRNA-splicing endonuclease subunit tsp-4 [Paramyrothecium foliicola]|nr:putative tRNA-splicing endonuclease subunit tsp-4 [Paramyrothecium foliicola]